MCNISLLSVSRLAKNQSHFFFWHFLDLQKKIQGHVPKFHQRGYWFILQIQRALPLIQPLLKYSDQKSYREWYGESQSWVKMSKGHDPNPWFSGITFFSGLALCSLQIKKRSFMGCLFFVIIFYADFSTFFHFGR